MRERSLNARFGTRVHTAGGLVKQDGAGDDQHPVLALAQVAGAFGQAGLVTLAMLVDEVVGIGHWGGADAFLVAGIQPAVTDIFRDGTGKQEGALDFKSTICY